MGRTTIPSYDSTGRPNNNNKDHNRGYRTEALPSRRSSGTSVTWSEGNPSFAKEEDTFYGLVYSANNVSLLA
jgi:hypothetical protein